MRLLHAYILVSHGPRYGRSVEQLPGAQTQLRVLKENAARADANLDIVGHDYARKIRSRDDLPKLFSLLEGLQQESKRLGVTATLFIDDYARLFRAADLTFRPILWDMLIDYADNMRDLRQKSPLNDLSREMSLLVRTGSLPRQTVGRREDDRPTKQRIAQTAKARQMSAKARTAYAKHAATALQQAYTTHKADTPGASFRSFLESPAAEGLKNSQGKPWTYQTGRRAIRELKSKAG